MSLRKQCRKLREDLFTIMDEASVAEKQALRDRARAKALERSRSLEAAAEAPAVKQPVRRATPPKKDPAATWTLPAEGEVDDRGLSRDDYLNAIRAGYQAESKKLPKELQALMELKSSTKKKT